jgi:hypothetical protein
MPREIEVDGTIYYPVEIDSEIDSHGFKKIRKKIIGLPPGENPDEYYICATPCGILAKLGTKYAAVKVTKDTTKDGDQWSVHGSGARQGKIYTGKDT